VSGEEATGTCLFALSDVTVSEGGRPLLKHLSLALAPGECLIVLGEAGSGKEVLLRLLGGFAGRAETLSGNARFHASASIPLTRKFTAPIRTAWLANPLTEPLAPHASVLRQLVRIVARRLRAPAGSAREELRLALERIGEIGLAELNVRPGQMAPLTMAKALVAAVSAQTPELVLADQPFADLGPSANKQLLDILAAEQKRLGFALLYATGGLQAPARLGGRVLVLRSGRVVEEGDAARLMSGHAHAYTRTLFKALPRLDRDPPKARSAARGQPLLQIHGLSFPSETPTRDGLSFELRRAASLALIGEEGSGRRVLLRTILGLDVAPRGKVLFDAVDLNALAPVMAARLRRRIAFITGSDDTLDPRMSIRDTVEEPLRAHLSLRGELVAGYRESALKRVGLASHDGRKPVADLSVFDKRRLQVARAIVSAPLLVVADDPLRGLDAFTQTILREVLIDFRTSQDPAFLVVTNDFTVAQALAEDAMVFADGKLVEKGSIAHLVRSPRHEATKALIEAVILPALSSGEGPV